MSLLLGAIGRNTMGGQKTSLRALERLVLVACVIGTAGACLLNTSGYGQRNEENDGRVSPPRIDGGAATDGGVPGSVTGGQDSGRRGDSGRRADDGGGGSPDADTSIPRRDWWNSAYQWRARVNVTHVPSDVVYNFAVLVRLCEPFFRHSQAQPNGGDLRFVSDRGRVLPSEIETWNRGGCSFVWVRLETLQASRNNNDFWLYFGNSDPADEPPNPATVWNNGFLGVWHLAEEVERGGQGAQHYDSTSHGNHGRQEGNGLSTHGGAIGGAQDLTGRDDRIVIPLENFPTISNQLTIEVRLSPTSLGFANHIYGTGNTNNRGVERGRYWQLFFVENSWEAQLRIDGFKTNVRVGSYNFNNIDWQYLVVVFDGSRINFFVDGVRQGSRDVSGDLSEVNTDFIIGDNPILPRNFHGHFDEVRISNVARRSRYVAATNACLNAACTSVRAVEHY